MQCISNFYCDFFCHVIYFFKNELTFTETIKQIPLLIFEVIPLREAGFL